jgi:hypothetical protein
VGKRTTFRRDATPPARGFHEYAEAATEWVFRYKFTVIVTAVLLVGVVVVWARRGGGSPGDTRAWETFSAATTGPQLEQALTGLKGTSAYPWAALRLGTYYYDHERFTDTERVLKPLADDEKAPAHQRGLALYVLGCTYLEAGDAAQAKNSFEKALTVDGKSPFLQELVAREEAVLKDWPLQASAGGETTPAPAAGGGGMTIQTPAAAGEAATGPPAAGGGTTSPPSAAAGAEATQPPATGGGEKTSQSPAAGGETRREAPTGEQ